MPYRVLLLGGYGTFGQRIAKALSQSPGFELIIAGRNQEAAQETVDRLAPEAISSTLSAARIDIAASDFEAQLRTIAPQLVIHTCGPFQGQNYDVARSCIRAGVHYVDLADSRAFVTGFPTLDAEARAAGVIAITGASSVPALSAAAVNHLGADFSEIHCIDHGINPGNQTPRGLATVQSILSYCGKPFRQWQDGQWREVYGWQGLTRRSYPAPMGRRWLGHCDIPDLDLFPQRYPGVRDVVFRAGLEVPLLHLGTWALSWLTRLGLIENWSHHARALKRLSEWFEGWGSTRGGMHVEVSGLDHAGKPLTRTWYLLADNGDGPQIPCTAAVVIAQKLAWGEITTPGAYPCVGLFNINEFMAALTGYAVTCLSDDLQASTPAPP